MATLKNFNWASLTRKYIINLALKNKQEILHRKVTPNELYLFLVNCFKPHIPIMTKERYRASVTSKTVEVCGEYHPTADSLHNRAIKLIFQFNPKDEVIHVTRMKFKGIAIGVADTILHEIIHAHQYRKRGFSELPNYNSKATTHKTRTMQAYLGNRGEIDAFGFTIACELGQECNFKKSTVIKWISDSSIPTRSATMQMYLEAFSQNHNHPIIKRLKKRIVHYIPFSKIGKPFNESKWLEIKS